MIGSVLLFFLTQGATFGLVGWLMGGPLAIGALAMFMLADTKSRSNPWFTANPVADEAGNEVVLSTIPAGDYFGEVTLDGSPRSASVAALEPATCFVIPRADFEGLIEGNPAFARDLIRKLAGRVRTLTERVFDLALRDVYERFAKFAEERAVDYGELRIVPDRFTQREIAARIGGSREMVSRILKDLATGGYVRVEDKRVVLLKKLPQKW